MSHRKDLNKHCAGIEQQPINKNEGALVSHQQHQRIMASSRCFLTAWMVCQLLKGADTHNINPVLVDGRTRSTWDDDARYFWEQRQTKGHEPYPQWRQAHTFARFSIVCTQEHFYLITWIQSMYQYPPVWPDREAILFTVRRHNIRGGVYNI